ncbi:MAG TPA: NYN domain-containing protein [Candidatus Aminicenantes bacterium]|nr:NYN domain-containing protein [Candidatus Aminicenantes bacterium]
MAQPIIENKDTKMAVLIDGDNAQASLLPKMLAEVGRHGSVTIRRIYGDWTTSSMHSWKDALHNHAVQPIQQFRYTVGKNATDSALIIDAMDIMHRRFVEGFCIISSDSDYTRLATRIREEGFFVMGIGQKKTPKSFVNACDIFIYTENLAPRRDSSSRSERERNERSGRGRDRGRGGRGSRSSGGAKSGEPQQQAQPEQLETPEQPPQPQEQQQQQSLYAGSDPMPLLREAFEMVVQENGWANLGPMGKALQQLDPGFDPRSFGQRQLSSLIKSLPDFEVRRDEEDASAGIWVRLKE